jgi:V8-like Glu-specific endopeptidase
MGSLARRYVSRITTTTLVLAAASAGLMAHGIANASATGSTPAPGVVHAVGSGAQQNARSFWTRSRMAAATPLSGGASGASGGSSGGSSGGVKGSPRAQSSATPEPPPGTPTATLFNGVPTVGALFFTTGADAHFCTASVVSSLPGDLILTAAHCVYSASGYSGNMEFVPGYHDGIQPYGAWPVKTVTVSQGWAQNQNQNLDFAFLTVAPPPGTRRPIQRVTGGLWLGINLPYAEHIEVIGYNDTDNGPVKCATNSFEFEPSQMEFYCHDYWDGTSGGPWIVHYNGHRGTGVVFGVIGGYEQGGDYEWASYSVRFSLPTLDLFLQATRAAL